MAEGREAGRGAAAAVNDTWIATKIQSKYFLDSEVKGHEIDVDSQNGVVTLTGTVATEAQKQAAAEIARETDGVARVDNQLLVNAAQAVEDLGLTLCEAFDLQVVRLAFRRDVF